MAGGGSSDVEKDWSDRRKEITYTETRAVLNHQISIMSDIDDKAMRTVRLTAILLGILAAGFRVAGPGAFTTLWLYIGGGFLFLSIITGAATYGESDLYIGPSRAYIEQITANKFVGTT